MHVVGSVGRPPALGDHPAVAQDHQAVQGDGRCGGHRIQKRVDPGGGHALRRWCAARKGGLAHPADTTRDGPAEPPTLPRVLRRVLLSLLAAVAVLGLAVAGRIAWVWLRAAAGCGGVPPSRWGFCTARSPPADGARMQQLFPEGDFFLRALTAMASRAYAVGGPRRRSGAAGQPGRGGVGGGVRVRHGARARHLPGRLGPGGGRGLGPGQWRPGRPGGRASPGVRRSRWRWEEAQAGSWRATPTSTGRVTPWSRPARWPLPPYCWTSRTGWPPYGHGGLGRWPGRSTRPPGCCPTGSTGRAGHWRDPAARHSR